MFRRHGSDDQGRNSMERRPTGKRRSEKDLSGQQLESKGVEKTHIREGGEFE